MNGYIDGKVDIFCSTNSPSSINVLWLKKSVVSGIQSFQLLIYDSVAGDWIPLIGGPSSDPTDPDEDTPPIDQPDPGGGYISSDFGENAINNHNPYDAWHSEVCQTLFNYMTKDFSSRCTSYQSYKTDEINDAMVFSSNVLSYCDLMNADIVYTPYVNAAYWMNGNHSEFVLSVGSHYDNDGGIDVIIGSDNNRHDITSGPDVFLSNSIAVSARRDTPELFKNSTSEGYGMEFFEDCSPEGLDPFYPDKDVPTCFAAIRTSSDGLTIYGLRSMDQFITSELSPGDEVYMQYPDGHEEHRFVDQIHNSGEFTVTNQFTPIVIDSFVSLYLTANGVNTKLCDVSVESGSTIRSYGRGVTSFNESLSIGDSLTLSYPDGHNENIIVNHITRYDTIVANIQPTQFDPGSAYIWRYDTIGKFLGGQAESWAVPIVAGKLKSIKMATNSNWNSVRMAARATAKRSATGIHEIDNSNWDIYRGFGCIDVKKAIKYINDNQ